MPREGKTFPGKPPKPYNNWEISIVKDLCYQLTCQIKNSPAEYVLALPEEASATALSPETSLLFLAEALNS